ncbi:MAG: hypothetical protein ABW123_27140 [Cystobacter sp.]
MHGKGFKWGMVAAAVAGLVGCGELPQQAGNDTYQRGFTRSPDVRLYNGTIEQLPTSIDPRTPDKQGTPERSLRMDPGERALLERTVPGASEQGTGGSGPAPSPSTSPYLNLGAAGSVISPSNQVPAAQSLPDNATQSRSARPGPMTR